MRLAATLALLLSVAAAPTAHAVTNLLTNSGFLDTDMPADGILGDGWGNFGATDFNAFFGAGNPHASLFADDAFNTGGVFQQGIVGTPGTTYQFDLTDVRIETNWDADLNFGVEFYAADDTTKLGETIVTADTATRLLNGQTDGNSFSMQATAPPLTAFARPIISFENVNFAYVAGTPQANSFVFRTFLSEAPGIGDEFLKNPGLEDTDGLGDTGDFWSSFGAAGFNDFFGGNGHGSLFADNPGNFGGIFQQSILGDAGTEYEFSLNDVRIESNFDADLSFGLEYYAEDNTTKLGETIELIDTNTGMVDGNAFVMSGTAPLDTVFVRPIVLFDNVVSTASSDENVFIFDASLTELSGVPEDADFDGDGDVDLADLVTLQRGFGVGTTLAEGDANGSGSVNGVDLAVWESQFTGAPVAAIAAVPEPTSAALLGVAAIGLLRRRR
ncbi:MAG: PEP-CTERM sorting domain-containing protein [Planctomycetota bacterium]